jgi:hypothetical protein
MLWVGTPVPPFCDRMNRLALSARPSCRHPCPRAAVHPAGGAPMIPLNPPFSSRERPETLRRSATNRLIVPRGTPVVRIASRGCAPNRTASTGVGQQYLCVIAIRGCEPEWCVPIQSSAPVADARSGRMDANSLRGRYFPFPTFLARGVRLSSPASQRTVPLHDGPLPGRGRPCAEVCAGLRSRPRTAAPVPSITPRWETAP